MTDNNVDFYFLKVMQYGIFLLPFAILTGPFFPDFIASLLVVLFLVIVIKNKNWKYFTNYFSIFFFIFYLYLIINSLLSDFIFQSLSSSLFYFRFGLFALVVWYVIENNKNFLKNFFIMLSITYIFALFCGYFQYFYGANPFGIVSAYGSRLTLPLNDKMVLGSYLVRLFPLMLALALLMLSKKRYIIFIIAILLILTDVLIFLSGERTALGLNLLSIILFIILLSKFKLLRIITLIFSVIFMILISSIDKDVRERNIDQTISQMNLNNDEGNIIPFSLLHQRMYYTSWQMFIDKPIFGLGPNLFRHYCDSEKYSYGSPGSSCNTHPHNTYLQLLAETGVVGFLFVISIPLLIIFYFIRHFIFIVRYKSYIVSDYSLCLMVAIFINLWPLAPTMNFFNNWINIIYFLPIGFYISSIFYKNEK